MAKRDKNGRFLPNHGGIKGAGRPPRTKEEEYLARFKKAVSADDFEKVSGKLLEMALGGDIKAIRTLFEYAIGKPTSYIEANVTKQTLSEDILTVVEKVYGAK